MILVLIIINFFNKIVSILIFKALLYENLKMGQSIGGNKSFSLFFFTVIVRMWVLKGSINDMAMGDTQALCPYIPIYVCVCVWIYSSLIVRYK